MSISTARVSQKKEFATQDLHLVKKRTKKSLDPSKHPDVLSLLNLQLKNLDSHVYDYDLVTRVELLYAQYVKAPFELKHTNNITSTNPQASRTASCKWRKLYKETLKKHKLPLNYNTTDQAQLVVESLEKGDFAKVIFLCNNTTEDLKAHYINLVIAEQHPDTALEILKKNHTQLKQQDLHLIVANAAKNSCFEIIHFLLDHSRFSSNLCIRALHSFTSHTPLKRLEKSYVLRILNPQFQKFHPTLISIALKLGHLCDRAGMCMGICSAGNAAILTGDVQLFNARLKKIFSLHSQYLSKSFDNEEEAIQQTAQDIEQDADLRAFFDTLIFFQQHLNANYLFALKDGAQKIFSDEQMYSLAGSIKLEMKGGIQSCNLACGIYNFWDFKTHLELLCKYFNDNQENFCDEQSPYLVVNLETPSHVISFGYDVFKKEFILNDSNFLPLKPIKNLDELSEILYRSLTQQFIVFPLDPFMHVMLNSKLISLKKEGRIPPKFEPTSSCNLRRIFESRFIDPKTQQTLLILASKYGYTDLTLSLMQARANLNHQEMYRTSPLMIAIQKGRKEIVKILLAANVDVNQGNRNDLTPLMLAAETNQLDVVIDLLSAKADVNKHSKKGLTSLMIAAQEGCRDILGVFLQANANINQKDHDNQSSLYHVIRKGHFDIAKDLIQAGALVDPTSEKDKHLLLYVVDQGHEQLSTDLIRAGADINQADSKGFTPLMIAVLKGHQNIVRILLSSKANVNQTNNAGCSALMLAADEGQSHILKDLIDAGADVNVYCLKHVTSLMIAAQNNHVDTVDLLLSAQAHMNARDILGRTALMLATKSNNIEIAKKLILAGANLNQQDEKENTSLMIAVDNNFQTIMETLLKAQADPNVCKKSGWSPLMYASQNGFDEAAQALIYAGANINQTIQDEVTALLLAADKGHKNVVHHLIQAGADVNKSNVNGFTPLMVACAKGHLEIVAALLAANANIDQTLSSGWSSLLFAVQKGHPKVVEYLVKFGANIHQKTIQGSSALSLALAKDQHAIIKILKHKKR